MKNTIEMAKKEMVEHELEFWNQFYAPTDKCLSTLKVTILFMW